MTIDENVIECIDAAVSDIKKAIETIVEIFERCGIREILEEIEKAAATAAKKAYERELRQRAAKQSRDFIERIKNIALEAKENKSPKSISIRARSSC